MLAESFIKENVNPARGGYRPDEVADLIRKAMNERRYLVTRGAGDFVKLLLITGVQIVYDDKGKAGEIFTAYEEFQGTPVQLQAHAAKLLRT